jgi:signal transduction histidine kinase
MRLATRFFLSASGLVAATVLGVTLAADQILRSRLENETAAGLEREARLVGSQLSADSLAWPAAASSLGALIGRRVTLIDPGGRVRGDTEFPADALPGLENHAARPEVRAATEAGVGRAERLSASTNERQLYVAVRGGPPGIAVVRVSATLAAVDAQVGAVQRATALVGLLAIVVAALLAWIGGHHYARPMIELTAAAQAMAQERSPDFPDSRIPEIAQHTRALRAMHGELETRFTALRREREETAALVEAMSDGVIASDERGSIRSLNTAARRLLRLDAHAPAPPLPELFHDKAAREVVETIRAGREVEQRELRLADRDVVVTGRPLPGGGALIVLRDISRLRRLETVRRDFVANVSHELKTPLTAIAGYAETLVAEAAPGSHQAKFAGTILTHARRMQRLVEDLLDLSRIESGGWAPRPVALEVAAAARDAWLPFEPRAEAAGVAFEHQAAPGADRLVADAEALRQVLTNLFDNALRHMPRGGRLTLSAAPSSDPDGVTLAIADTGTGIPAEHLPRIFERFYRVDPSRSREEGGTGLGLAIVKHLVEAHSGRVTAESTLTRGTTIHLTFPSQPAVTQL